MIEPTQRPSIGILLFDDVEVLDFAGPYEVFSEAVDERGAKYCSVVTVALEREVCCRGGLEVRSQVTVAECPPLDLLVVPGGPGTRASGAPLDELAAFLRRQRADGVAVASVCTGAFLLARAGLLDGRSATTHHSWLEKLSAAYPAVRVVTQKVVDEGNVITAGGVTSGIDLSLYLLERWFGPEARAREARRLEGPWT